MKDQLLQNHEYKCFFLFVTNDDLFSFENLHNYANYTSHDVTCLHISHNFLILYEQEFYALCKYIWFYEVSV